MICFVKDSSPPTYNKSRLYFSLLLLLLLLLLLQQEESALEKHKEGGGGGGGSNETLTELRRLKFSSGERGGRKWCTAKVGRF